MVGERNQNVFFIQIDASSFAEFEISEFEISRFDCISIQQNAFLLNNIACRVKAVHGYMYSVNDSLVI